MTGATDLMTTIRRRYGLSEEDANRVIALVAEETMQRYLDAHPTDSTIGTVGADDQIASISRAVIQHYRDCIAAGMRPKHATRMVIDMQGQWLERVLPMPDMEMVDVAGEDAL